MGDKEKIEPQESKELVLLPENVGTQLEAIKKFQATVRHHFVEGQDFGIIPGTDKPTLLKPGAEKMAKLMKCYDHYTILTEKEDFDKPLFAYKLKCTLFLIGTEAKVSDGIGACNSMESKYRYRWLTEKKLPEGIDKRTLPKKELTSKYGKFFLYRVENDDLCSQQNTILKMAKKRALVDAALSAGRLSDIFTQDMEEAPNESNTGNGEQKKGNGKNDANYINKTQIGSLENLRKAKHIDDEKYHEILAEHGIKHRNEIPKIKYLPIVKALRDWINGTAEAEKETPEPEISATELIELGTAVGMDADEKSLAWYDIPLGDLPIEKRKIMKARLEKLAQ